MKDGGVTQYNLHTLIEISTNEVLAKAPDGKEISIPADTVVLSNMESYKSVGYKDAFAIGDALLPRRGNSALLDGFRMGMRL